MTTYTFKGEMGPADWSALPRRFYAGERVARFDGPNYGSTGDDLRIGGIETVPCTLDGERFFTVPLMMLDEDVLTKDLSSELDRAEKIQRMTDAVMAAIDKTGDQDDIIVMMGSLGAVVGCIALASTNSDLALAVLVRSACSVISGDALNE